MLREIKNSLLSRSLGMKPGFVEMDYNVLITQKHYKSQKTLRYLKV